MLVTAASGVILAAAQSGIGGYAILYAGVAASWIGVPIVGAGVLAAAGVLASDGELNIWLVIAVATAAAWTGGYVGYLLGARASDAVIQHPGPWRRQRRRAIIAGQRVYRKWGRLAVFVTPTWVSGALRMPRSTFLVWNALAALTSTCIAALGAYGIGAAVVGQLEARRGVLALAAAVLALSAIAFSVRRRRHLSDADRDRGATAPPASMTEEDLAAAVDVKRRLGVRLAALVVLAMAAVGLITAIPGLHGIERRLDHVSAGWLLLAVALELLSGHGYVLSFAVVFPSESLNFPARMPWLHFVARVAWLEQGFQAVVPAGGAAAEVPGALVLRARGKPWGWIAQRSTVLFLLTSAINAIVISLFGLALALRVLPGPSNILLAAIPAAVGVGVLALFLALPLVLDRALRRRDRGRLHTRAMSGLASSIRDVRSIVLAWDWRLLGPVAYLLCDIAVLWVCFAAVGDQPPLASLVLGYQIGYLADLVPVPGGVGALDGGLIGALVLYGANATDAAAAVLLYHAIALAVPLAVGALALALLPRTLANTRR